MLRFGRLALYGIGARLKLGVFSGSARFAFVRDLIFPSLRQFS